MLTLRRKAPKITPAEHPHTVGRPWVNTSAEEICVFCPDLIAESQGSGQHFGPRIHLASNEFDQTTQGAQSPGALPGSPPRLTERLGVSWVPFQRKTQITTLDINRTLVGIPTANS